MNAPAQEYAGVSVEDAIKVLKEAGYKVSKEF